MFLLYNLLLTLAAPFWAPWVYLKSRRRKESPNWSERTGAFDIPARGDKRRIWVHTVSVGEFVAAVPILKEIRKALPKHEILVSVTTSSGHQTARDTGEGLYDHLVYFPIDVARFQLSAMQQVRPDVVAIMETELWMNFVWAAKTFGARTMVVNGRISDRSFPRSSKLGFFYKALLKDVDRCLMQSETDVERIVTLGAKDAAVFGNCKFDGAAADLKSADPGKWRSELKLDPAKSTIVIGSTRGEEEERFVLDALAAVGFDRLNVVHAPRHLERADPMAELIQARTGAVARRSKGETGPYLLLDTYGELGAVYAVADIVIVGGGFENLGGQNIIQPLAQGKPVLHGQHMQNFRDVAEMASRAGASQTCKTPTELTAAIQNLLQNPELRKTMGQAAQQIVKENIGASRRYAEAIAQEAQKAKK